MAVREPLTLPCRLIKRVHSEQGAAKIHADISVMQAIGTDKMLVESANRITAPASSFDVKLWL